MDHYIDITALQDPDFTPQVLLNAIFSKLHKRFVELASNDIGVSFPNATEKSLGFKLRLHGSKASLGALMSARWIGSMQAMVGVSEIALVPAGAAHMVVRRVRSQVNIDRIKRRLVRRLMAREGVTEDVASARIQVNSGAMLKDPYLEVSSSSTGQKFRFFIRQKQASEPVIGSFNCYGISASSTLPSF